jgi:hypothetical protein
MSEGKKSCFKLNWISTGYPGVSLRVYADFTLNRAAVRPL